MAKRRRFGVLVGTVLAVIPACLSSQQLDQAGAEEILVQALRYMIEVEFESKFSDPVITGAGFGSELADSTGLDLSGVTEAVAQALGIRVQGYRKNTFCDMNKHTPHLRSRDADLRIGATLSEVIGTTARVAVNYTGGTLLAGSTVKEVNLERTAEGWSATGLGATILHGSSTPCQPPAPSLATEDLADILLASILSVLNDPTLGSSADPIEHVCVDDQFDAWGQEVVDAVRERLRGSGLTVHRECVFHDQEEDRLLFAAPTGEPASWFQLRFVVSESEENLVVQVGVWPGTDTPPCGRFASRPCVFECSFETTGEGWGAPSLLIAPFSVRRPPESRKDAYQPAYLAFGSRASGPGPSAVPPAREMLEGVTHR